jgi:hypothetical protein
MTAINSLKIIEGEESLDFQNLKVTESVAHTQHCQSLGPEFVTT